MAERHPERNGGKGRLIVFFGPMFSGKTGALVDEIERSEHAGRVSIVIKPSNDDRYSIDEVVSHSGKRIASHRVPHKNSKHALEVLKNAEVGRRVDIIAFDEGQFFEKEEFLELVQELLAMDKIVIVAGLPTDGFDEPFGAIPELIAKADEAIQMTAYCTFEYPDDTICGRIATKTLRLFGGSEQVVIGGEDMYAARCRDHWVRPVP